LWVHIHLKRRKKECLKGKEKQEKKDKMPKKIRVKGHLMKIPGQRAKVRVRPHLRKIKK